MQLHYGCKRDNNTPMFDRLGPDTGYDCINNYAPSSEMADFLNFLNKSGNLPKTIIYSLNPNDNQAIGTILGCFQDSTAVAKIQQGSAWWFNDHKTGMQDQMISLANLGNLSGFVGMLTDSRSFLSYARHDYFRRILCNLIGGHAGIFSGRKAQERIFMELRTAASPRDVKHYTTERLREEFLIDDLFQPDVIKLVYSHIDRIITGSAVPVKETLKLTAGDELRAQYFCERRELGVINIGGAGVITIDGKEYNVAHKEGMYIGMGSKDISFASENADAPAKFYLNSAPAHMTYPTVLIKPEGTPEDGVVIVKDCNKVELGSLETANHRTICKYILPGQVESCQLEMGMTKLEPGSVWNTMPCHTHDRRMEVYLYFDMPEDALVMHYMGEPTETRHIVMRNEQAVISPSWSIHSGCGTQAYTFIWGMVGENQDFDDMDDVAMTDLM